MLCPTQVLVASDVASRGLDVRGLPYVVNYDFPTNLEVYIHRVGRTGRLAAAGHAFSFFTRPLVSRVESNTSVKRLGAVTKLPSSDASLHLLLVLLWHP